MVTSWRGGVSLRQVLFTKNKGKGSLFSKCFESPMGSTESLWTTLRPEGTGSLTYREFPGKIL